MTGYTPEPWQNASQPLGPGQPYPVPDPGAHQQPEPLLVAIGDISVTATRVVTPSGTAPLGQCRFHYTDMSRTTDTIPPWAIVLAVVFALLCLLGLLFLLVKEQRTEGAVQVVVQGPGLMHTSYLPVWSPYQAADYAARVNHARALAMGAGR